MSETVIGSYEAGQISLSETSDGTRVSIHWPFDRELDDWIDVSVSLDHEANQAIASSNGIFSVGSRGQEITIIPDRSGGVIVRCVGRNSLGPTQVDVQLGEDEYAKFLRHFGNYRQ